MRIPPGTSLFNRQAGWLAAAGVVLTTLACGENTTAPPVTVGLVQVAVATTGLDLDPDGYTVLIDGADSGAIGIDGSITVNSVQQGARAISLGGLADNCAVTSTDPVTVTVVAEETSSATFTVLCEAAIGDLEVTTVTTGVDIDPDGFTLVIDGESPQAIGVNDNLTSTVMMGTRTVELTDVADNCTVTGDNPRTVNVPFSGSANTTFVVSCASTTGGLVVSASTSGTDIDPDGYSVSVDGGAGTALGVNAAITLNDVQAGDRMVELSGIADNCSVGGTNPRTVTVVQGSAVQADFVITCVPIVGSVEVITATAGVDLDPDGYMVEIEGKTPVMVGINDTIQVDDVLYLDRDVELTGLAANCSVQAGVNPRTLSVPENATISTTFVVVCEALEGNVSVTASTTGSDQDDQYMVSVDGGAAQPLPANGTISIPDVPTGDRDILLTDIAPNCTLTGDTDNPKTVTVPASGTVSHTFNVSCVELLGSVEVTTVTTGPEPDPNGYSVTVEGETPQAIGTNATITVSDVSVGDRMVELTGLEANCSVMNNPRSVTVVESGTVSTTFNINCAATLSNQIVFDTDRDGQKEIYVMNPNGSNVQRLTNNAARDAEPFVSPNGAKIAFVSDRNGNNDIWVMDADGGNQTQLTNNPGSDTEPAWNHDGTKIVFSSDRNGDSGVWIMDADGSNQTVVSDVVGRDGLAQFSPDGTQIVFTSARGGTGDLEIWTMNTDGSNTQQLTNNTVNDFAPAWSPNGLQIAYTSETGGDREIYVMSSTGTGQTPLTNDPANDLAPQWSPDGTQIAFASERDGNSEVYVMQSDGTFETNISNSAGSEDFEVSWR